MISPTLLRTRVARRILLLFLVCAILPVVTFAVLAYYATASRLETDAREALRQGSKTTGMIVMDRLHALLSELGAPALRPSFEAIAVEHSDGRVETLRGTPAGVPVLSESQRARLADGRPVLLVDSVRGASRAVFVLPGSRELAGFPRTWGVTSPTMIVGADPALSPVPDGTELCLLDGRGTALDCPSAGALHALTGGVAPAAGELSWQRGDSVFLVAHWSLFLEHEFASPPWTVALSMPKAAVLVPLAAFRRTFLLGVALAGLLVFVLSHVQLRKRMTPLAELEAGVRRISAGDFATPVLVKSNDEFETLAASFNGMASDLRHQFNTLTALRSVDVASLETRSATAIAEAALHWAPELLHGDRAVVAFATIADPARWTVLSAGRAGQDRRKGAASPHRDELAELEAHVGFLHIPAGAPARSYCDEEHLPQGMQRLAFPLRYNGHVHAVLIVGRADPAPFAGATTALGRQLADQLAVGLSNVSLLGELNALSVGAMIALARTIDASSPWTAGHSERVTLGAIEIARRLGFDQSALEQLHRGGLLHDIGKIGVPAAILEKPGPLTPAERAVIQTHPGIGADIIRPIAAFRELIPLVRHHHELLDGSGYPDGLAGPAIPDLVRILTVADVYDALVSDRPYRKGVAPAKALAILWEDAGTKFDERAVRALEDALNDGWSAIPIAQVVLEEPTQASASIPRPHALPREEILV